MPTKKSASTSAKITSIWPELLACTSARPIARAPGGGRGLDVDGEGDHQAHGRRLVVEGGGASAGHGLAGLVGATSVQCARPEGAVLPEGAGPGLARVRGAERAGRGGGDGSGRRE